VECELHTSDAQSPIVPQQVTTGAFSIHVDAVCRVQILEYPAFGFLVDVGMALGDAFPAREILGDDQVVFWCSPDGDAAWLKVDTAKFAFSVDALQVRDGGDGGGRGLLPFALDQEDEDENQDQQENNEASAANPKLALN